MVHKAEDSRERILQAALEEFALKGPAGARVNEIAARAEINKERIYAYYQSKDGLFTAVLRRTFERLQQRDEALDVLGADDLPQLVPILLRHLMDAHAQDPTLWRILAWENLCGGIHLDAIESLASRGYDRLAALYRSGQEQGRFPAAVSFPTFITALIGLAFFHHSNQVTMSRSLGRDLASPAERERFVAEITALFAGGA